jgi:hypothetical protein
VNTLAPGPQPAQARGATLDTLTERDFPAAAALVARVLEQRPEKADVAVWRWRTVENPAGSGGDFGWLLRDSGGACVGVMLNLPQRMWVDGQELAAGVSSNWAVAAEHRRHGLLLASSFARQRGPALLLNTSANHAATEILRKLGFLEAPAWGEVFFWVVRPGALAAGLAAARGLRAARHLGNLPIVRSLRWKRGWPAAPDGIVTSEAPQITGEFDDLWLELRREHKFTAVRSSRFLTWRLHTHPIPAHRAQVIVARNDRGRLRGYVAWRRAGTPGMPVERARIVDLFAPRQEPAVTDALVRAAIAAADASGVAALEIAHVSPQLRARFRQLGAYSRVTTSGGYFLKWTAAPPAVAPDEWSIAGVDGDFAM